MPGNRWLLLALALGVDGGGWWLSRLLGLPILVDATGTIGLGLYLGPRWGAAAGLLHGLAFTLLWDPWWWPYTLPFVALGYGAGYWRERRPLKTWGDLLSLGAFLGTLSALLTLPIQMGLWGGLPSQPLAAEAAASLWLAGYPRIGAAFLGELLADILSITAALFAAAALWQRMPRPAPSEGALDDLPRDYRRLFFH
ncbi:MAG: hypothetical protein QJR00_03990 [Bacillota bacterium]|nr:hypothetical protein [Bacillota bacterium]